ncbi:36363_t:CDS:2, partial [Gigaspora margarita]
EEPKQSTLLPELAEHKLEKKVGTYNLRNRISKKIKKKGKGKDKELEEKIVKIEQSVKSEQGMELPFPQEESLTLKVSNVIKDKKVLQECGKGKIKTNCKQISMLDVVNLQRNEHKSIKYFTLWNLPNSISNRHVIAIVKNMEKEASFKVFYFNTKLHWELEPVFKTIQEIVDNRNKNLQKDISGRSKREPMKEQDKETAKARSKAIKISKKNPYMNNGDFNCIVDLELDKISKSKTSSHKVSKIHRWLSMNNFIDTFRFLNLTEKEVTWSNSQSGTRIDQIWESENLMESLTRAEILDMYFVTCSDHKATSTTLWLNLQIFGLTVAVEKNRKHYKIVYLYDQTTAENWKDFRLVLDKKLQKEKAMLNKLSCTNISKNNITKQNKKFNLSMPWLPMGDLEDWYDDMKGWW